MKPAGRLIVIGAGPAGLMCAGTAARRGIETILLEKTDRPGLKLSITGNGRCNLTNSADMAGFIKAFGNNGGFLRNALKSFSAKDALIFFKELGFEVREENSGKYYLDGRRAVEASRALAGWAEKSGAVIRYKTAAHSLVVGNGVVKGVVTSGKENLQADAVVVACGGKSYPGTGSSGDGYGLAGQAGHAVVELLPALVPLVTEGDIAQRLKGLTLPDVSVCLFSEGKKIEERRGGLVFTHFGVSGPSVLLLGRAVSGVLAAGRKAVLRISAVPGMEPKSLDGELARSLNIPGKGKVRTILKDFVPERFADIIMGLTGVPTETPAHQLSGKQRRRLVERLTAFELGVAETRGFAEAQVTCGGVAIDQVNPKTMESRLCRGLYFAGEVLDVDGDTGGFNLQAAFSTGVLAGRSVFKDTLTEAL